MHEYRITKYDPARRDEHGAYPVDDWTAISDVGKGFGGVVLTREEYERVENAYLQAVRLLLTAADVDRLCVRGLEGHGQVHEGQWLELPEALEIVRTLLREDGIWCRLEADGGFVHVGWDYYMYVGAAKDVSAIVPEVEALGLYVEPGWTSPYHPDEE